MSDEYYETQQNLRKELYQNRIQSEEEDFCKIC